MPKETTGLFDGFFGSGFDAANTAFEQVQDDVSLLIDGVRVLLRTYQDLEEANVAKEAIGRILDGVKQAALPDAIRKARLLPLRTNAALPEAYLTHVNADRTRAAVANDRQPADRCLTPDREEHGRPQSSDHLPVVVEPRRSVAAVTALEADAGLGCEAR